jgi:hypothetical protein
MRVVVTVALLVVGCAAKSGSPTPLPGDPACVVPAGVSTTESGDACYALFLTAGTYLQDGSYVAKDLCSPNQYGMFCFGSSTPDRALACVVPPGGEGFGGTNSEQVCCPCAAIVDGGT